MPESSLMMGRFHFELVYVSDLNSKQQRNVTFLSMLDLHPEFCTFLILVDGVDFNCTFFLEESKDISFADNTQLLFYLVIVYNTPFFLVRILGDSSCEGSKIIRSSEDRIYKNELVSEK